MSSSYLLIAAVAFAAVAFVAADDAANAAWLRHKTQHNRVFAHSIHEMQAKRNFERAHSKVQSHNADPTQTFQLEINKFSDVHHTDFLATSTGFDGDNIKVDPSSAPTVNPRSRRQASYPASIDWTMYMNDMIRDQGQCGSCWTFAAAGVMAGMYNKMNNATTTSNADKKRIFSEQQIVDCDSSAGKGCSGGDYFWAMKDLVGTSGMNYLATYPYTSGDTQKANPSCQQNTAQSAGKVGTATQYYRLGQEAIMQAIQNGPVAVSIFVDDSMQAYKSGVFKNASVPTDKTNHAVVAVGYGTDSVGGPYWKLRNSWGGDWGEAGYIRIARSASGMGQSAIGSYAASVTMTAGDTGAPLVPTYAPSTTQKGQTAAPTTRAIGGGVTTTTKKPASG